MTNTPKLHFLIVDDDPDDILLTETILRAELSEVDITSVSTVQEALENIKVAEDKGAGYDVVLTDLHLPDDSGVSLVKNIKERADFRHVPIYVMTGSRAHEDIVTAHKEKVDAYFRKPLQADMVKLIVNSVNAKMKKAYER